MTHHDFDLSDVLERLQNDESEDMVRQMVDLLYQALTEAEATEVVQAQRHERSLARSHDSAKRFSAKTPRHQGLRHRTQDRQIAQGVLLSERARASPSHRPGSLRRRDGGLRPWGLHAQGRRPDVGPRSGRRDLKALCANL